MSSPNSPTHGIKRKASDDFEENGENNLARKMAASGVPAAGHAADGEVPAAGHAADGEVTKAEVTNTEVTNPKVTNSEVTNSEVTNSEVTNSEVTNPELSNGSIRCRPQFSKGFANAMVAALKEIVPLTSSLPELTKQLFTSDKFNAEEQFFVRYFLDFEFLTENDKIQVLYRIANMEIEIPGEAKKH
jgi:hypothetical protein